MTGRPSEVQRFLRAALVEPVPRDHREDAAHTLRRKAVCGVTILGGAVLLGLSLSRAPGDAAFYGLTSGLAACWVVGALASGSLHLGRAWARDGRLVRPVLQPFLVGAVAVLVFAAGAVLVARVPLLRQSIDAVLDHARYASLPVLVGITVVNGVAEELFFRGALYAAVRHRPVLVTTAVYTLTTLATGNVMLVFAAALLGLVAGLERRVTGGFLAPLVTHVTWSVSMLLILPFLLGALR